MLLAGIGGFWGLGDGEPNIVFQGQRRLTLFVLDILCWNSHIHVFLYSVVRDKDSDDVIY